MPDIIDVRKTEVTDRLTIPKIGFKFPKLRPKSALPEDEGSEPKVEDESPSSNTTESDTSPLATKVDNEEPPNPTEGSEDNAARPDVRREAGIFDGMQEQEEDLLESKPSPHRSKKRKKAISKKTTQRSNTRVTRASVPKAPPQVDPTAGGSENDGNDPPTEGTKAHAVTPARPA